MTTATRETANLPGPCPGAERMVWPVQTHPAQSTGPESKRNSGDGEYFSLDFSFYRTALPENGHLRQNGTSVPRFSGRTAKTPSGLHLLQYLSNPKAWNDCDAARKEWNRNPPR